MRNGVDVGDAYLWQVEDKYPLEGLCWNRSSFLDGLSLFAWIDVVKVKMNM